MRTRWPMSCAVLVLSVAACARKSETERVAEHERVRVAWEQTSRFVGAEWTDHALPDAYAARTLARAGEELQQESKALQKEELSDQSRVRLRDSLAGTRALADSLASAISTGDRGAVARLVMRSPRPNSDSLRHQAALP